MAFGEDAVANCNLSSSYMTLVHPLTLANRSMRFYSTSRKTSMLFHINDSS
ncbi:hypothetical protein DPMN_168070 [Dreissena polymorpha]|uniref:Uncharacterized protein n=1 Tax=Dreissena polymorpha TaxID=45954 RepID=A0A9D4F4E5_DREPO|nr:hypothetical protein DPMN_168070 [Dreissena polymorpha]